MRKKIEVLRDRISQFKAAIINEVVKELEEQFPQAPSLEVIKPKGAKKATKKKPTKKRTKKKKK